MLQMTTMQNLRFKHYSSFVPGESIVREVCNKMPVGLQVFKNQRTNYHVTLFHTSKIHDPRPDPTLTSGGVKTDSKPAERPSPTPVCPSCWLPGLLWLQPSQNSLG
jgi:hypothetical protein